MIYWFVLDIDIFEIYLCNARGPTSFPSQSSPVFSFKTYFVYGKSLLSAAIFNRILQWKRVFDQHPF